MELYFINSKSLNFKSKKVQLNTKKKRNKVSFQNLDLSLSTASLVIFVYSSPYLFHINCANLFKRGHYISILILRKETSLKNLNLFKRRTVSFLLTHSSATLISIITKNLRNKPWAKGRDWESLWDFYEHALEYGAQTQAQEVVSLGILPPAIRAFRLDLAIMPVYKEDNKMKIWVWCGSRFIILCDYVYRV